MNDPIMSINWWADLLGVVFPAVVMALAIPIAMHMVKLVLGMVRDADRKPDPFVYYQRDDDDQTPARVEPQHEVTGVCFYCGSRVSALSDKCPYCGGGR